MNQLRKHKWHYLNLSIIFALFLITVQVRKEKLSLPLSTELEWVTAHTLITLQVWEEGGGPHHFGFRPVYTYSGKGNEAVGNLGGVMGKDRKLYYTSYPPFAFIFAYYGTKLLGGTTLSNLRTLGMLTHLFCAILIYLIIIKLRENQKDQISIAGLLGAFLYLFSAGTLWMHSIMYFADTSVQLFLITATYLFVSLLTNDIRNERTFLAGLGITIFLGTYTEWLALFFAFFAGLLLFILYFINKKRINLKGFLVIASASALALLITFLQYASINGVDALMDVSISKYLERAGFESIDKTVPFYNWKNPESFLLIEQFANRNFAMVINLFGLLVIATLTIGIWKKFRVRTMQLKWRCLILLVIALSVLLHYLLFFNFNTIHNISNLKSGFFMILFSALVVLTIEEQVLSNRFRVVLAGILLVIVVPRVLVEIEKFNGFYVYDEFDKDRAHSAQLVRNFRNPEHYVFANIYVTPEYIYKAHHNVFQLEDTARVEHFMHYFQADHAQFYFHENNRPMVLLELARKNNSVVVERRIPLPAYNHSNKK